jgi:hypothetical protein
MRSAVAEGVFDTYVPAGQLLHSPQLAELVPALKLPFAHAVHARSTVAEGTLDTDVPAGQVCQSVQLTAFSDVENSSPEQAVQVRSVVVDPPLVTCVPVKQVVLSTQTVAGSPSESQVPAAQGNAGLVPPAQYSPALHEAHTAAEVEVPAAICTMPAAQLPCDTQPD